jgi:hypothetical protein
MSDTPTVIPAEPHEEYVGRFANEDCLTFMARLPSKSVDLVFGSPPYENYRSKVFNLKGPAYIDWMVAVTRAATRVSRGLVCWVINGQTHNYRWNLMPVRLALALHDAGIAQRQPCIFHRSGVPGSGGPDFFRINYEFILCCTDPSIRRLPWSDPTSCGKPCSDDCGGWVNPRQHDGSRHRQKFHKPALANPGLVISGHTGLGHMGHPLAHRNQAPFPDWLVTRFIRSLNQLNRLFSGLSGVVASADRELSKGNTDPSEPSSRYRWALPSAYS